MAEKTLILNKSQIDAKIERMVHEINEQCYRESEIILCGVEGNGGVEITNRIKKRLEEVSDITINTGSITINKDTPLSSPIQCDISPEEYKGKIVIIIDDVSNSGKTLMYAAKYFMDEPVKALRMLVLVDRSHNRYPIKANFVGMSISTTLQERIHVEMNEKEEAVYLV